MLSFPCKSPWTLEAQLVLKWIYRQEADGSEQPRTGSCQYPMTPVCCPQQHSPEVPAQILSWCSLGWKCCCGMFGRAAGAWDSLSHPRGLLLARGAAAKARPSARSVPYGECCQAHTGNTKG